MTDRHPISTCQDREVVTEKKLISDGRESVPFPCTAVVEQGMLQALNSSMQEAEITRKQCLDI